MARHHGIVELNARDERVPTTVIGQPAPALLLRVMQTRLQKFAFLIAIEVSMLRRAAW
jgi:hypothetical protein